MSGNEAYERQTRWLRNVCAGSFLLSLGLAFALVRREAAAEVWGLGALALLTVGAWTLLPRLRARGWPCRWFLSLAVLNLLAVVPELALRLRGFRYESGRQFGYPQPSEFTRFVPHPQLLWTYAPGQPGVNAWGFREREVRPRAARERAARVVFLGDSCTEQGYPAILELLHNARHPEAPIECLSLALSGYSSWQGRRVAELYGARAEADVAVVWFGWNDHWLAYGAPDAEKRAPEARQAPWRHVLAGSRLLQLAQRLADRALGRQSRPLGRPRVSAEEYRANLTAIYGVFERLGVPVVFVTAPSSHAAVRVPDFLVSDGLLPDKATGLRWHAEYNAVVREVQRACPRSVLCDLETAYRRLPPDALRRVFMGDGIHFMPAGLALVASDVLRAVEEVKSLGPAGGSAAGGRGAGE